MNRKEKIVYYFISRSNKFDVNFYRENYDLGEYDDPLVHYIKEGIFNGCKPNETFDIKFYLNRYPDVKNIVVNPFYHYIRYGVDACRLPYYLTDDEINQLGLTSENNVIDYLIILNSDKFDSEYYSSNYGIDDNPIVHFVEIGASKGFNPNSWFDTIYYLSIVPDADKSMNTFVHYLRIGRYNNIIPKKFKLDDLLNLDLNKSLKGYNDFIFLFNDTNNEIRQHFDSNYNNYFKVEEFLDDYYFKKNLFEKNNIQYYYFSIPDKSVVCRNFLPFEYGDVYRNVDKCDEIIDFADYLNNSCYYKINSHINHKGSEILSFKMFNHINKDFTFHDWNELMDGDVVDVEEERGGDLLTDENWSFSYREQKILNDKHYVIESVLQPKNIMHKQIWPEFKFCGKRESVYIENPNSFSDKRALIFRDSSFTSFINYFSFYFKEIFVYWDHGSLNEQLINVYHPDIVLEVRTERFIDNLFKSEWVVNKKDIFEN